MRSTKHWGVVSAVSFVQHNMQRSIRGNSEGAADARYKDRRPPVGDGGLTGAALLRCLCRVSTIL